ncbi:DUF397 domain-containing protein [Streptomyces wuyuanensis]|uniref:DUF397 domain-containing protein n=1 Tax=Streptomyces wuyuanensis TaxID=1196353 RepID=UPI003820C3D0
MASIRIDLSAAAWRKSSYSNGDGDGDGGACVEVADGLTGVVPVRDSKLPDGPVIVVPAGAWAAFVTAVKA